MHRPRRGECDFAGSDFRSTLIRLVWPLVAVLLRAVAANQCDRRDDQSRNASRGPPRRRLAKVAEREHREHRQRHDFLDDLQLRRGELPVADAVRRHLEARTPAARSAN